MKKKRESLKPDRPLASLAFSKTGKVRLEIEHLPRTKKELELSIRRKFVSSLSHFHNRWLSDIRSGGGRGDLICKDMDSSIIKIQVVEMIDPILSILTQRRTSYRQRIMSEYSEILDLFQGCYISISDTGNAPFLPPIQKKEGIVCLRQIVAKLADLGENIASLPIEKIRVCEWKIGKEEVELLFLCERFAPKDMGLPYSFRFSGTRYFSPGEYRYFLRDAIRNKIEKRYSKSEEKFWLLVYSTDTLLTYDDPDILESVNSLKAKSHPFDAVWYMYPYDNSELGHLLLIWQR
jgi:hypothetical protein